MTCCPEEVIGASPLQITWSVVRGDTAVLRVDFVEDDETTPIDNSGWIYQATAFDPVTEEYHDLIVEPGAGHVIITAEPEITSLWGVGTATRLQNLVFDLEVTKEDSTVWTPVIGNISLVGDVTLGGAVS